MLARVALGNLERAAVWSPYDWRVRVTMGDLAMLGEEWPRAAAHFERALALAERPETQLQPRDGASGRSATRPGGLAHLERAVRLNPSIFKQITDSEVARTMRRRLDASGYGARHAWMYEGTPAAHPARLRVFPCPTKALRHCAISQTWTVSNLDLDPDLDLFLSAACFR